jgi:hypothetical protein
MKAHAHVIDFPASSALKRTFTRFIKKSLATEIYLRRLALFLLECWRRRDHCYHSYRLVVLDRPHYILFSVVCVHIGLLVIRKRQSPAIAERPHRLDS